MLNAVFHLNRIVQICGKNLFTVEFLLVKHRSRAIVSKRKVCRDSSAEPLLFESQEDQANHEFEGSPGGGRHTQRYYIMPLQNAPTMTLSRSTTKYNCNAQ